MLRSLALLVAVGAARAYRPASLAPLHANHAMTSVTRQARAPVLQADRAPPPSAPVSRALRAAVGFVDRRYFLVGIGCAIGLAAGNPAFGRVAGPLRPELTVSWGASCAIFLISGLTLPTSALAAAARRVKLHAAVQSFNLGLIPLGALGFTTILSRLGALAPEACAGLLAMSALPTTINMCIALTRSAGGNEAVAIFNAVVGNFLGIFLSPLLLLLLVGRTGAVPLAAACRGLAMKVLAPLLVGQLARRAPPIATSATARKKSLSRVSETCLLLIVYVAFCDAFARGNAGLPPATLARIVGAVGTLHAAALAAAWRLASRLGAADRVAFTFTSTHKTLALGMPLLRILFADAASPALLLTPLLIQHPLQLLVGSLLVPRLRAVVEAEAPEKRS